jgi:hypothetical protein
MKKIKRRKIRKKKQEQDNPINVLMGSRKKRKEENSIKVKYYK